MLVTSIDILYCERLGWRFEVMRWLDIHQSANDFLPLSTYEWIHDWPFVLSPHSFPSFFPFPPSLHPLHKWHLSWSPAKGRERREKDTSRDKGEKDFEEEGDGSLHHILLAMRYKYQSPLSSLLPQSARRLRLAGRYKWASICRQSKHYKNGWTCQSASCPITWCHVSGIRASPGSLIHLGALLDVDISLLRNPNCVAKLCLSLTTAMTLTNGNRVGGGVTTLASSALFSPTSFTLSVAVLLLVATMAGRVDGGWNHSCTADQMVSERRGHVCGSNIPKTLQLVCGRRGTADRNQQHQSCRGRRGK